MVFVLDHRVLFLEDNYDSNHVDDTIRDDTGREIWNNKLGESIKWRSHRVKRKTRVFSFLVVEGENHNQDTLQSPLSIEDIS